MGPSLAENGSSLDVPDAVPVIASVEPVTVAFSPFSFECKRRWNLKLYTTSVLATDYFYCFLGRLRIIVRTSADLATSTTDDGGWLEHDSSSRGTFD